MLDKKDRFYLIIQRHDEAWQCMGSADDPADLRGQAIGLAATHEHVFICAVVEDVTAPPPPPDETGVANEANRLTPDVLSAIADGPKKARKKTKKSA